MSLSIKNKRIIYLNIVLGAIGTILIALGAMRYHVGNNDDMAFPLILVGFGLTMGYINYLERKARVSRKLTWTRAIGSIILFFTVSYFLFY